MSDQVSKTEAQYREAPNNGDHCGRCRMFRAPDVCAIVAGPVQRFAYCRLFEAIVMEVHAALARA